MDAGPSPHSLETPPHTGTTVVAVAYAGGVVLGADSRVSTGTYISNRASDKITPLADNVHLLRSGSAADTQAVADYGEAAAHHSSFRGSVLVPLLSTAVWLLQCGTSQSSTRSSFNERQTCTQ